MKTQMKAVWAILIMTTIWLTMNSSKINTYSEQQQDTDVIVQNMIANLERKEIELQEQKENEITFSEAFQEAREDLGEGDVFFWRGDWYSTDYAKEEEISVKTMPISRDSQWVLNGDDLDDYCKTNNRDECGVCGGYGASVWYADRDGDGLGDASTMVLNCDEPSALNE